MSEQINFHQLVNLAFDSNEINSKYLEALLHGLVHKMEVDNTKIELRGGQFSDAYKLINALGEQSQIEISEYEAQKNDASGKYDKKKQIKKCKVDVNRVMVFRDVNTNCALACKSQVLDSSDDCPLDCNRKRAGCDAGKREKRKSECPKKSMEIDDCIEHVLQNCDVTSCPSDTHSEVYSEYTLSDSQSNVTQKSSQCQSSVIISDVDTRLLACVQEMTTEIDQIKCQLRKTQNCLTRICENSKLMANSDDENDAKFDEIMKLFDDYEKRISRNCMDICACQKLIQDNVQRIDATYEEIETLYKVKAEKDEMEAALKKKADKCELEHKVDVEMFDAVKAELSEAILDIYSKLKALSNELDNRVKQICQCLNTKMDRDAFCQFAKCIEDRIKQISMETKKWINMKKKEVCPYATKPYVQNLQCGACAQEVVMKGEESNIPCLPSFSRVAFNCQCKKYKCERTGGHHTITTAEERNPKQINFYQQFEGPCFSNAEICKGPHMDFPQTCYDTINNQKGKSNENITDDNQ